MVHRRAAHASRSKERIHICATPQQQRPRTAERVLVLELCAHRAAAANGREESHHQELNGTARRKQGWRGVGGKKGSNVPCRLSVWILACAALRDSDVSAVGIGWMARDGAMCSLCCIPMIPCRLQTQSWFPFCSSVNSLNAIHSSSFQVLRFPTSWCHWV